MHLRKTTSIVVLAAFLFTSIISPGYAQSASSSMPWMPKPGAMVQLSPEFTPAHLKGITIHPDNALMFDFIIQKGDETLSGEQKQAVYKNLIKYFLASLAVPDENQWVNLSPYEKNRIITDDFGKTEMGRDLLAQDYILKQIIASLIYPEDGLGKKFWDKVYSQAQQQFGTTNIPVNTFNKVWIIPDDALVYETGNTAYVLKNHLKVMLEEDYLSLAKYSDRGKGYGVRDKQSQQLSPYPLPLTPNPDTNQIGAQIVREIVLPALEHEVNHGKNFAMLRQVYSGMILAAWYKRALKESLLSKIYANKSKVKGVDQVDPKNNEAIYNEYLKAYKKGVFNYIKEDMDKLTNQPIPRKYFSGGTTGFLVAPNTTKDSKYNVAILTNVDQIDLAQATLNEINDVNTRIFDRTITAGNLTDGKIFVESAQGPFLTSKGGRLLGGMDPVKTKFWGKVGGHITGEYHRFSMDGFIKELAGIFEGSELVEYAKKTPDQLSIELGEAITSNAGIFQTYPGIWADITIYQNGENSWVQAFIDWIAEHPEQNLESLITESLDQFPKYTDDILSTTRLIREILIRAGFTDNNSESSVIERNFGDTKVKRMEEEFSFTGAFPVIMKVSQGQIPGSLIIELRKQVGDVQPRSLGGRTTNIVLKGETWEFAEYKVLGKRPQKVIILDKGTTYYEDQFGNFILGDFPNVFPAIKTSMEITNDGQGSLTVKNGAANVLEIKNGDSIAKVEPGVSVSHPIAGEFLGSDLAQVTLKEATTDAAMTEKINNLLGFSAGISDRSVLPEDQAHFYDQPLGGDSKRKSAAQKRDPISRDHERLKDSLYVVNKAKLDAAMMGTESIKAQLEILGAKLSSLKGDPLAEGVEEKKRVIESQMATLRSRLSALPVNAAMVATSDLQALATLYKAKSPGVLGSASRVEGALQVLSSLAPSKKIAPLNVLLRNANPAFAERHNTLQAQLFALGNFSPLSPSEGDVIRRSDEIITAFGSSNISKNNAILLALATFLPGKPSIDEVKNRWQPIRDKFLRTNYDFVAGILTLATFAEPNLSAQDVIGSFESMDKHFFGGGAGYDPVEVAILTLGVHVAKEKYSDVIYQIYGQIGQLISGQTYQGRAAAILTLAQAVKIRELKNAAMTVITQNDIVWANKEREEIEKLAKEYIHRHRVAIGSDVERRIDVALAQAEGTAGQITQRFPGTTVKKAAAVFEELRRFFASKIVPLQGFTGELLSTPFPLEPKEDRGRKISSVDFYRQEAGDPANVRRANPRKKIDAAQVVPVGGIDLNAANLNLQIKRDGKGVPLPLSQQNWESIKIEGLIPVIISINPATSSPLFSQLNSVRPVELAQI